MAACKKRSNQIAPRSFFSQDAVSHHCSDSSVCKEILEAADKWDLLQEFLWLVTLGLLNGADNKNYVSWSCAGRRCS